MMTKLSNFQLQCLPLGSLILALGNPTVNYLSLDLEGAEMQVPFYICQNNDIVYDNDDKHVGHDTTTLFKWTLEQQKSMVFSDESLGSEKSSLV